MFYGKTVIQGITFKASGMQKMTIDDFYEELCPSLSCNANFRYNFKKNLGFIWCVTETDDYLRFPTLSLVGIGQVHLPIFKEVM